MSGAAAAVALHLAFAAAVPCNAPPGTIVAAIRSSGGDGSPVALSLSAGDTADFALSGATIVVAAGGIAPGHCDLLRTVTITATQN